jgi:archaellum biogenesis protein FlaJ (TadC family)
MENKRLMGIVLTVVVLLLIPLIAMQFTNEVNWTLFDFVVAGVLLLGTGFICELVIRKVKNQSSNPSLWSYSGSASPHLD